MKDLRKDDQLNIRMTKKQKRRIEKAARVASRLRQQIVEAGPLLLECGMPAIEGILAAGQPEQVAVDA